MQTTLSREFQNTATGRRAEEILRKCVHCGFCNATCPTHELLGDELDGPRGRIYQMKQLFEGAAPDRAMRLHLDRCLLCRSCETTCPSGVAYSSLLEISKTIMDEKLPRPLADRVRRRLLERIITSRRLFARLLQLGRFFKRILPRALNRVPDELPRLKAISPRAEALAVKKIETGAPKTDASVPVTPKTTKSKTEAPEATMPQTVTLKTDAPNTSRRRKMIALAGCVQAAAAPNTNRAAAAVLGRLGITLVEAGGCCGGVALHTSGEVRGRAAARALIDCWLPHLEQGAESFVMTASGCGVTIKEYPRLFEDDPEYRQKARRISEKTVDLCEVLARELPPGYAPSGVRQKVAFHAPCTLRHGQRISGEVEAILARAGHTLCAVRDAHLCCGSAGTYSILQPAISTQLRRDKQAALAAAHPQVVCTANIGCQLHLGVDSTVPVVHWVELLV